MSRARTSEPSALTPDARLDYALTFLTWSIAELTHLSGDHYIPAVRAIEQLRTRRHQLSVVIDRLAPATSRGP
jgi:hypothetical protein